jgi:type I restriction enzyme M protein
MSDSPIIKNHAAFIWSVADLLRGDYKQSEYGKVIMPLTVIRRLDCVLEPTKDAVLDRHKKMKGRIDNVDPVLCQVAGQQFYNTSQLTFTKLLDDPNQIAANLRAYIAGFSESARDIIEKFGFDTQIEKLANANLLYQVVGKFAEVDLHPDTVSNLEMGYLYEELIHRFSELSNETAGEHFTPREVIKLMVNLLFIEDNDVLATKGTVRTLYDPACGTGGMLSVAEDYLRHLNPDARLEVFGQELNDETYAICRSDMMIKGQDASHITAGNSLSSATDGHRHRAFDYCIANPPFGDDWKKVADEVRKEHLDKGMAGRFGAGLPSVDDGSVLFLLHMMAKMKSEDQGGSRIAVVFNGSPLLNEGPPSTSKDRTGNTNSIRRWIIENDWLEAIVALPDELFYNTGISTYFWIVTNRKRKERRGKVQLIDAREYFIKMRKSLGEKRKEISDDQIAQITRLYADFAEGDHVKIFPNEAFGYMRITVERPLRAVWRTGAIRTRLGNVYPMQQWMLNEEENIAAFDDAAGITEFPNQKAMEKLIKKGLPHLTNKQVKELAMTYETPSEKIATDEKGEPVPDTELRDNENVPLPAGTPTWAPDPSTRLADPAHRNAVDAYMRTEVLPYVSDAWVDYSVTKLGYEIPITKHFFRQKAPRGLIEIERDIAEILEQSTPSNYLSTVEYFSHQSIAPESVEDHIRQIDSQISHTREMLELLDEKRRAIWIAVLEQISARAIRWIPLGYLVREVNNPNRNLRETNLLSLSYGRVVRRDIQSHDGLLPESFDGYNIVLPGDTVLRLTDLQNDQKSIRVGHVTERGIITSAYVTIRSNGNIDPRYLTLVLQGMDARKDFYALGAGVRQSLKFDELRRLMIPLISPSSPMNGESA